MLLHIGTVLSSRISTYYNRSHYSVMLSSLKVILLRMKALFLMDHLCKWLSIVYVAMVIPN